MFCKKCGTEFDDNIAVCPECGTEVDIENEKDDFDNHESRREKLEEIKERRDKKRRKEQRKKIIFAAVLVAVIIAAAGGILAWLNSRFGENVVVEDPKNTAVPVDLSTPEPSASPTPEITAEPTAAQAEPTTSATPAPAVDVTNTNTTDTENTIGSTSSPKSTAKSTAKATSKPRTSSAVVMGSEITNKYVKFDKVHVSSTGNYVLSFKMGTAVYYANVNKGTQTSQVKDKYYYITAHPTSAVYNGMPVYEITSMSAKKMSSAATSKPQSTTAKPQGTVSNSSSDFVLFNSSTGYVTDEQLNALSADQLNIAKNEIYARHGRKFKSSALQSYFNSKSWYSVNSDYNYSNDSANLSQLEKTNLLKILAHQS